MHCFTLLAQTERSSMNNAQLELSLGCHRATQLPRSNRQPSAFTSRWWFERMRQIADRAFDWQPTPPPRPEQIWFRGTHRQVSLNS
jgi:hypothetical protein